MLAPMDTDEGQRKREYSVPRAKIRRQPAVGTLQVDAFFPSRTGCRGGPMG
jgi:hypothetical protein